VRILPFALFPLLCIACAHEPTMRLNHAEISGVTMATLPPSLNILMTVVLDVQNPNSYDVAVRAVRGQTVFSDQYPLNVTYQAPPDGLWLPAGQTTSIRVPMTVPLQLAMILVQQAMTTQVIGYHFIGKADVTATRTFQLEKDNYAIDARGSITRDQMAAVIPNSLFPH
jgi:hypothetical protein